MVIVVSDNFMWVMGFVTGFLIVAVIFGVVVSKKKNKQDKKYDERQVLARGSAFSAAFFTAMGYMVVCALVDMMEIKWAELGVQMLLGLFLCVSVFASVSILKDAYLTPGTGKKASIISFSVVIAANGFSFVHSLIIGESIIENGMLGYLSVNLGVLLAFIEILAVIVIKHFIDSKADVEE